MRGRGSRASATRRRRRAPRANWRLAAAFLRGAARQFGISYGWYTANFYDGYRRGAAPDARPTAGENAFGPVKGYPFFGLNRGASFDLIDRQNAYGWLIGARYVEPENWYHYHMQPVERDGRREHVPSRAAKDFQSLYDLSKREDRGIAYAPLALLMPIHERVLNTGDADLFRGFRQSAPLLTLVPACPIDDFRRQGIEGGFYNSEFGEMFDVVCPDATNDVAATLAALRPYKAAALFGRFRLKNLAPAAFTHYAEEGGTLFVSEDLSARESSRRRLPASRSPERRSSVQATGWSMTGDIVCRSRPPTSGSPANRRRRAFSGRTRRAPRSPMRIASARGRSSRLPRRACCRMAGTTPGASPTLSGTRPSSGRSTVAR